MMTFERSGICEEYYQKNVDIHYITQGWANVATQQGARDKGSFRLFQRLNRGPRAADERRWIELAFVSFKHYSPMNGRATYLNPEKEGHKHNKVPHYSPRYTNR